MPITLGPIVMSGAPGTGSFWLQQMLQEPDGCGLGMAGRADTLLVRRRHGHRYDRHAPGPCTVAVIRNVDEFLRSWFVRFRNAPPPPEALVEYSDILHSGHHHVYLGEINKAINYYDPSKRHLGDLPTGLDFRFWLDSYLTNAAGMATDLFNRFTIYALHTLHQENLLEEVIEMLRYENVGFDEAKVRAYPRINQTKEKPPWPEGYQAKLIEAG